MHSHSARRLTLEPLAESAWRLCDQSVAPCNAENVMAYVEQREDGLYEVTWVAYGFGTATYATIGDLLRGASALLAETPTRGGTKPIPIPHRPPLAAL